MCQTGFKLHDDVSPMIIFGLVIQIVPFIHYFKAVLCHKIFLHRILPTNCIVTIWAISHNNCIIKSEIRMEINPEYQRAKIRNRMSNKTVPFNYTSLHSLCVLAKLYVHFIAQLERYMVQNMQILCTLTVFLLFSKVV